MTTTHLPDQISLTPPDGASPLFLESMVVRGTVAGNNCLTEMILTFMNESGRTLEGELNFPLPQSGVVSGFGYEINGRMVDGVIVEKEVARVAFEKEVRSGGKAALVEHVAGNAFKTRIYPIQPNKPISVKVVYLSDVEVASDGSSFSLPLCIVRPLKTLKLHLEIRGSTPVVREADDGLNDLKFTATGNDFATDVELQNFKSKKNLLIGLSAVAKKDEPQVLCTTFEKDAYFLIHDIPAESSAAPASTAMIKSIAVVWDASLSMENVSKKRVLKVLSDLYALPALQGASTTLIIFRQVTEPAVVVADAQDLLAKLNAVDYDGGTDLANLRWLGAQADYKRTCDKGHALTLLKPTYESARWNCDACAFAKDQDGESWHCKACGYDMCGTCYSEPPAGIINTPFDKILLVTDGFSNLSDDVPLQIPTSPVFVLNIGTQSNALSLTMIANKTGGQFLDLTRIPDDKTVLQAITSSSKFSFLSATFDAKDFADVLPSQPQPILAGEKFSLSGKLLRGAGTVTINYGTGGKITATRQVNIQRNESENGLVAKLWAGMKVKELAVFAEQNKKELLNVARKYGIVTPGASILVLSDLDAYLKHGIEPSEKALPDVYGTYKKQLDEKQKQEDNRVAQKVQRVIGWWQSRKGWYDRDFSSILKEKHRANWETTMRAENPKIFSVSSAPPALPPAPGPHTAKMTEAEVDAHVNAHPPRIPEPERESEKEKRSTTEDMEDKLMMMQEEGHSEPKRKANKKIADHSERQRVSLASAAPAMAMPMSSAGPSRPMMAMSSSMASAPSSAAMELRRPAAAAAPISVAMGDTAEAEEECKMEEGDSPAPPPPPAALAAAPAPPSPSPASAAPNPDDDGQTASGISIKAWTPDMPYLNRIKAEAKTEQYAAYLKQRKDYRSSPAFYLDVATYFFSENELKQYGHRVLTSIADLGLEEPGLLRIVGYKLSNEGMLRQAAAVFGRVLRLREKEPQSWRDLGNVLSDMGLYQRSLECFQKVITGEWDSNYSEIELTVLMEANRAIDIVQRRKLSVNIPLHKDLIFNMPCDLRISCGWDTNDTDIDLHVREPDGTECYYGNKNTPTGGLVSRDFTRGYGPEEYMIKIGLPGTYIIKVRYYAAHAQTLSGGTTVLLNVFTDWARGEYERCQKTTVRLQTSCDNFEVARIEFAPSGPRKANLRSLEEEWNKDLEKRAQWVEQWDEYNKRQSEISQWQSGEAAIQAENQAAISAAEQRYIAKAIAARNAGSGKNLNVPPSSGGGSSPRSPSPGGSGSGKNLAAPAQPGGRSPSPGKSLASKIGSLFGKKD